MAKICGIAILARISLFHDILAEYQPCYPKYRHYKKKGRPIKIKEEDICKRCQHDPNTCEACVKDIIYTTDGDKVKECKFYKESKKI